MNIQEKIKLFEQWKKESYYPYIDKNEVRYRHSELDDIYDFFSHETNNDKIALFLGSTIPRIRKMVAAWIDQQNINKKVHENPGVDFLEILSLDKSFKWVQLIGKNSFDNEGLLMDHCVASYFNDKNGNVILSLRNEFNEPKITVEYNPYRNMIIQVRARRNNLISKKYSKYLMELFNYLKSPMNSWIESNSGYRFGIREKIFDYGLYIRDNTIFRKGNINVDDDISSTQCFDVLTEKTNLVCDVVHYNRRFGLLGSIICDILTFDYNDLDMLKKIEIEASKSIRINNCPEDVIIDQPSKWICKKIIIDNYKRMTLQRLDFGGLYIGTLPAIDYDGVTRNQMTAILSGVNSGKTSFFVGGMGSGKSFFMREWLLENGLVNKPRKEDAVIDLVSKKLMNLNKNYDSVSMNINPSEIINAMENAHMINVSAFLMPNSVTTNAMPNIIRPAKGFDMLLQNRLIVDKKKSFTGKL